jgi:choice-of-anchor B domain-containing protein
LEDLGAKGSDGNDIWGWTDPDSNREYALAGTESGTSIVDVTDPTSPCVLGFITSTNAVNSLWRDIKVYRNFAFIVSEARGHGMQIFDLKQLKTINTCSSTRKFTPTTLYTEFGSAHNLVINEDSGFAYAVGTTTCKAGLHIVNIRNPVLPVFAGCYGEDGYVHDAQCVNYDGPDSKYKNNAEVCFCYNEDSLTIVDVTNKAAMKEISRTEYAGSQYTHQGWLLPGQGYLLLNDELDEIYSSNKHTRTMLWDVNLLEQPALTNSFYNSETVVDHNLYTLGKRVYLSNYCGGLRIYDTSNALHGGVMTELGYFDVAPDCSTPDFFGSWSSYIYFPSGNIVVNSIERGMFTVKFNDPAA